MSSTETATPDGADHTVVLDKVTPGMVAFEYGYIPTIVFGVEDGKLEVARFGDFTYEDPNNFSTVRGEKPTHTLPTPPASQDRIAALEEQVATLIKALADKPSSPAADAGGSAPSEPSPAPTPTPEPVSTPFTLTTPPGSDAA